MPSPRARLHASVVGSVSFSLLLASMPTPAAADPTDGTVVAGTATITQTAPNTTVITQTSQRAIIDWRSFNIGENEIARFDQPNSSSIALNRITGGSLTTIQGSLLANGQVWLINPNGIAFARGARVDVAGLIATTLDIDNRDFMAGRYNFAGPADGRGTVTNAGHITIRDAGLAALVAPGVENSGIIEAHYGRVTLGSTPGFTVDFYGDGRTRFLAGDKLSRVLDGIGNDKGRVALTVNAAKAIVDHSVNLDGASEATGLSVSDGSITLTGPATGYVSVSGTVDTSGPQGTGGHIDVTAKDVRLTSTASLNASGSNQGGIVRVGGDWHGQGNLPTASTTTIDDGTLIRVDAVQDSAGSAVVWSDNETRFAGTILATGGTSGGSVEVSGKRLLDYTGTTDLRSASGRVGSLLLDPQNVRIATTGATPSLPGSGATTFVPSDADSILSVVTLQNALALGNVTVTTGTTGTQAGDITVANSVSWSSANSLSLEAFRNIAVGDGVTITNTGAGNLSLRADSTGTGAGTVTFTGTGKVNYSGSTGLVSVFYNPSGYATPTSFAAFVMANGAIANQAIAYMLVNNLTQLQAINTNLSGNYALGRDIDASATATWNGGAGFSPIKTDVANSIADFSGIFDGLNHTVTGLTINRPGTDNVGMFRYILRGTVRNLILSGVNISGGSGTGGLAADNIGTISNVRVTGTVIGANSVGGLVGRNDSLISASQSGGAVTGSGTTGGLVGYNNGGAQISKSSSNADVRGAYSTGGLIGANSGGIVDQSFAQGAVRGTDSVGGLIGAVYPNSGGSAGTFTNVYATGSVTGSGQDAGGLIGANVNTGGIPGTTAGSVNGAYATGRVVGGSNIGGLIGRNEGAVSNAYWDTETSGVTISSGGAGRSTAQLKSGLPVGFDPTVWAIDPATNNGYPHLKWQDGPATLSPTTILFSNAAPPPTPPTSPIGSGINQLQNPGSGVYVYDDIKAGGKVSVTFDYKYATIGSYTFLPISQRDAIQYSPGSMSINDWAQTCKATVYTMIARALGDKGAHISDFWNHDSGAVQGSLAGRISAYAAFSGGSVKQAIDSGQAVVIRGSITNPPEDHYILATGINSRGDIIANDPWTGNQIIVSAATGRVISPANYPLNFQATNIQTVRLK